LDTAKLFIKRAININNKNPKYYVTLAEIHYSEDNMVGSIDAMEKALKLRPHNVNYLLSLASLYEEVGNLDMAKKYYFKVLEIEPGNELAKSKI
jgi:tetratricopeptide (TPR) repeat protein